MSCFRANSISYYPDELNDLKKVEAMLCGILRVLEPNSIEEICRAVNWTRAGVREDEFRDWLKRHRIQDDCREAEMHKLPCFALTEAKL